MQNPKRSDIVSVRFPCKIRVYLKIFLDIPYDYPLFQPKAVTCFLEIEKIIEKISRVGVVLSDEEGIVWYPPYKIDRVEFISLVEDSKDGNKKDC